jgi:hypothetical protein
MRAVLGADTDADLGFYNPWQAGGSSDPDGTPGREAVAGDALSPQENAERLAGVVSIPGAFHGDAPVMQRMVGNDLVVTISATPAAKDASGLWEFGVGHTNPARAAAGAEADRSLVAIRVELLVRNPPEESE